MKKYSRVLSYLITAAIGLAMAVAVFSYRGGFSQPDAAGMYFAMCDAFFVPGVIFASIGLMAWISHDGLFDIMAYGLQTVLSLANFRKKEEKRQSYYDYKMAKEERRKRPKNVILWVGVFFLAMAVVCLILLSTTNFEILPVQ